MKIRKEKESLQVFCSDEHPYGELYRHPHFNSADGGRLVATDGVVMCLVKSELLRGKYETISQKIPDFGVWDMEVEVKFDAIERAFCKFDLIPEKVSKDGDSPDCPECAGTGRVEWEYTDDDGRTYYMEDDCPVCDGTGKRDDFELVETGRMVLPPRSVFRLCGSLVDASRLMDCVGAFRKMGFDGMVMRKADARGGNVFTLCDGFVFVIMSRCPSGEGTVVEIEIDK